MEYEFCYNVGCRLGVIYTRPARLYSANILIMTILISREIRTHISIALLRYN